MIKLISRLGDWDNKKFCSFIKILKLGMSSFRPFFIIKCSISRKNKRLDKFRMYKILNFTIESDRLYKKFNGVWINKI